MISENITVSSLLERLANIPNNFRKFNIVKNKVQRSYGIRSPFSELEHLNSHGFFCEKHGNLYYDPYDLIDLAFYLKLPSLQNLMFRTWSSTLRVSENTSDLSAHISFVPMPEPPPDKKNKKYEFNLLIPGEGRITVFGFPGSEMKVIHKQLRTSWPGIPSELKPLVADINELDFFMLPEELRWHLEFIKKTKMADCGGASKSLAVAAKKAGFEVRHYIGLVPAKPYSSVRYFTEILIDDIWVPVDPHLLKILKFMKKLDPVIWPFDRSPGACLIPVAQVIGYSEPFGQPILEYFKDGPYILNPVATHNNLEVPVSLPTEIITGTKS